MQHSINEKSGQTKKKVVPQKVTPITKDYGWFEGLAAKKLPKSNSGKNPPVFSEFNVLTSEGLPKYLENLNVASVYYFGVSISAEISDCIIYDPTNGLAEITITTSFLQKDPKTQKPIPPAQILWNNNCRKYGFNKEDFGKTFTKVVKKKQEKFQIVGVKPKNIKNNILAKSLSTGKLSTFSKQDVAQFLNINLVYEKDEKDDRELVFDETMIDSSKDSLKKEKNSTRKRKRKEIEQEEDETLFGGETLEDLQNEIINHFKKQKVDLNNQKEKHIAKSILGEKRYKKRIQKDRKALRKIVKQELEKLSDENLSINDRVFSRNNSQKPIFDSFDSEKVEKIDTKYQPQPHEKLFTGSKETLENNLQIWENTQTYNCARAIEISKCRAHLHILQMDEKDKYNCSQCQGTGKMKKFQYGLMENEQTFSCVICNGTGKLLFHQVFNPIQKKNVFCYCDKYNEDLTFFAKDGIRFFNCTTELCQTCGMVTQFAYPDLLN